MIIKDDDDFFNTNFWTYWSVTTQVQYNQFNEDAEFSQIIIPYEVVNSDEQGQLLVQTFSGENYKEEADKFVIHFLHALRMAFESDTKILDIGAVIEAYEEGETSFIESNAHKKKISSNIDKAVLDWRTVIDKKGEGKDD